MEVVRSFIGNQALRITGKGVLIELLAVSAKIPTIHGDLRTESCLAEPQLQGRKAWECNGSDEWVVGRNTVAGCPTHGVARPLPPIFRKASEWRVYSSRSLCHISA